jgi:hypothetical protein
VPRARWDTEGTRTFETGVDQGMLYVSPYPGVPWNGIASVSENSSGGAPQEFYFDGRKYASISSHEDYSATVDSFTIPDELSPCIGRQSMSPGLIVTGQPKKQFGFSYRTLIGDDIQGTNAGYRIHLVYNAHAGLSGYAHETTGEKIDVRPYSLAVTTVPEDAPGYRPSAHFIIDSRKTDPAILSKIEDILYGNDEDEPRLITVHEIFEMIFPSVLSSLVSMKKMTLSGTAAGLSAGSGSLPMRKMSVAGDVTGFSADYRGGFSFASSSSAASYAFPLTGWNGANPAVGDFLAVVVRTNATAAQTWGQSAGSTWTKVADNEGSGKAGSYSYAVYYRVMQTGDTAPTFTWTTSTGFIVAAVAIRPLSGSPLAFDAVSAKVDAGTSASGVNAIDPAAATSAGDGISLVMLCGRGSTNVAYASHTFTPPSGWTAGENAELQTGNPRVAAWAYKAGLPAGSSDPGSLSWSDSGPNTFALSAVQLLVKTTG